MVSLVDERNITGSLTRNSGNCLKVRRKENSASFNAISLLALAGMNVNPFTFILLFLSMKTPFCFANVSKASTIPEGVLGVCKAISTATTSSLLKLFTLSEIVNIDILSNVIKSSFRL